MDGVELLERIYAPEPDWHRWGSELMAVVAQGLSRPRVLVFTTVAHGEGLADTRPLHIIGPGIDIVQASLPFFVGLDPETVAAIWYPGQPVITHAELTPKLTPRSAAALTQSRSGFADCLGALAYPQPGLVAVLCVMLEEIGACSATERRFLRRLAAHLEGGTRLRVRPDLAVAAVVRADGLLVEAADDEVAGRRDQLARHVHAVEQTRHHAARSDPDAIRHWRALVDGAYTIVPRQVGRGSARREYLFVRNGPLARRDARLGLREAEVVRQLARGSSQKEVAYALGISAGGVSAALERARMRLGLTNRLELVRVARASFGRIGQPVASGGLTDAERAVLSLLREGLTNADIARLRGASQHTVANQVASILKKTSATNRRELALRPDD
jgi:DNA-binding CsgD family transcriptional regulator